MPDSIAELEESPLNTLMRRIEWVIKWDMTSLNDRGWAVPDQLKEPYEDHFHLIKSTDRNTQIDKLMHDHFEWKDLVTAWIGGPGMGMRDLSKEYDLIRLMKAAKIMHSYPEIRRD